MTNCQNKQCLQNFKINTSNFPQTLAILISQSTPKFNWTATCKYADAFHFRENIFHCIILNKIINKLCYNTSAICAIINSSEIPIIDLINCCFEGNLQQCCSQDHACNTSYVYIILLCNTSYVQILTHRWYSLH